MQHIEPSRDTSPLSQQELLRLFSRLDGTPWRRRSMRGKTSFEDQRPVIEVCKTSMPVMRHTVHASVYQNNPQGSQTRDELPATPSLQHHRQSLTQEQVSRTIDTMKHHSRLMLPVVKKNEAVSASYTPLMVTCETPLCQVLLARQERLRSVLVQYMLHHIIEGASQNHILPCRLIPAK